MFNINDFLQKKINQSKISVLTCYDFAFASILEKTDIDVILVGDSLGNAVAGYPNTLPVTLDQMIYHAGSVRRGAPSKYIVTDMPFMSYQVSIEQALHNAGRIMKETDSNAVKLEGGAYFADTIKALVKSSIPVMGHLGLTPQSVQSFGGYKIQGRESNRRAELIDDALILEESGVIAIVLEMIPEDLAAEITSKLSIPTIGIGAGKFCDGQVLVINDMLGMNVEFTPKFAKKYLNLNDDIFKAVNEYNREVKECTFPSEENTFK
jgi:3-methyl-2-oxobutanoate hydroxymethyltransferase